MASVLRPVGYDRQSVAFHQGMQFVILDPEILTSVRVVEFAKPPEAFNPVHECSFWCCWFQMLRLAIQMSQWKCPKTGRLRMND